MMIESLNSPYTLFLQINFPNKLEPVIEPEFELENELTSRAQAAKTSHELEPSRSHEKLNELELSPLLFGLDSFDKHL